MRRFLVGFLAVVGALFLILAGTLAAAGWWLWHSAAVRPDLPPRIVLSVDLRQTLAETSSDDPFTLLGLDQQLRLADLVATLQEAGRDPRVVGLVARLAETGHGFAVAQEVRGAVERFAEGGGFTVAWADSFGELGAGNEGYYIATAFDEIGLQPGGMLGLIGLGAEVPFVRPLLDRLGVTAAIARRSEYKTVFDSVIEEGLTPAYAEMLNDLLDHLYGQLVEAVAHGRGLTPGRVEALIDAGPLTAEEAHEAGLVDRLAHRDEVIDGALARAGDGAGLVEIEDYAQALQRPEGPAAEIALIAAQGTIHRGESRLGGTIAGDVLADALATARDDPSIRAVLLRLDTGGGSAVASETVAREVRRTIEAGKPVVVSMGNAAASGGYWIAMGASHIVAQPATLTGSIGVIAGKPVLADAWDQLGVRWERLERGANAGFMSLNEPFDATGRARLEASVDDLYDRFVDGVAAGRNLPREQVETIARGRVWLGEQAARNGLVDELGGFAEAGEAVRRLLGLAEDEPIRLLPYPPPRSPLERLRGLVGGQWLEVAATVSELVRTWQAWQARHPLQVMLPKLR